MSTYDVCEVKNIEEIVFSKSTESGGRAIAYFLRKWDARDGFVKVGDARLGFILMESAEHARNLQKALDKAIELGWLK